MGKSNGFVSGFSGRLGNVVGYVWRGKSCVRTLPSQFNDAKTERQLEQRSLFKQTIDLASRAKKVLHVGLHVQSVNAQMTECNYFMHINKRCFSLRDGELEVDYASLVVSDGPVAPVAFGAPQLVDETTLVIDFEKNPLHRVAKSDDNVYLAVYCPELNDFRLSNPVSRSSKHLEMNFPSLYAGKEVHLWGFVQDYAGRASMSQYIGCGVLTMEEVADDVPMDNISLDGSDSQSCPSGDLPLGVDAGIRLEKGEGRKTPAVDRRFT